MDSHAVISPHKKGAETMTPETDGMLSSFFRWLALLANSAALITKQAEKFAEGQSALGILIVAITALLTPTSQLTEIVWSIVALAVGTFQGIAVLTMDRKVRAKAALFAFIMWVTAIAWFLTRHMKFAVGLSLTSAIVSWLVYVFCNTSERLVYDVATDSEYGDDFGSTDITRDAIKVLDRLQNSKTKR